METSPGTCWNRRNMQKYYERNNETQKPKQGRKELSVPTPIEQFLEPLDEKF